MQANFLPTGTRVALEGESFTEYLEALRYAEDVKDDQEAGIVAGVEAVPMIVFINKRLLREAMSLPTYRQLIGEEL